MPATGRAVGLAAALLAVAIAAGACRQAAPPAESLNAPPPSAVRAWPGQSAAGGARGASAGLSSPELPGAARHDLSVDEALGGHTLERHVGRTDRQLRDRLQREPDISAASTYTDRPTAEQVVARAFVESASAIDTWTSRQGRRPNLVLDRTEASVIGRSLGRRSGAPSPCRRALVVLRWDARKSRSFVLSSYPECGR